MFITNLTEENLDFENITEQLAEANVKETTNAFVQYVKDHIPALIGILIWAVCTLIIFFIGTKVIRFLRKLLKTSLEKAGAEVGLIQFLDSLAKFGLYLLLIFILIGRFGGVTTSLAAIIASAGVAIGLALQGSLSNFAGGVLILLLKPFVVGDLIVEDTHKNEGTVKEIQLCYTKLVTADNKIIIIPNGQLSNNSLTNVTDQGRRRLDLIVGIGYQSDLKLAKKLMLDILRGDEHVLQDQDIQVFVDELADSAVNLGLRAWVGTDNFITTKWRVLEAIKLSFDDNRIEIPYNQLDVYVKKEMAGE